MKQVLLRPNGEVGCVRRDCNACHKMIHEDSMHKICRCCKDHRKAWVCNSCWEKEEDDYRQNGNILEEECEQDREQYKSKCEECEIVLCEMTPIECLINCKDGHEEMTLCNNCWEWFESEWRAEGWIPNEDCEHEERFQTE